MFEIVGNRVNANLRGLALLAVAVALLPIAGCNKQSAAPEGPKTFATPDEAGKALVEATGAQNKDAILAIFGPGSEDILSTGDPAQDKAGYGGLYPRLRGHEPLEEARRRQPTSYRRCAK